MITPQPAEGVGPASSAPPEEDRVLLTLGSVDPAAITQLRWRLHSLIRTEDRRIVVDASELDEQKSVVVFACLVNAHRLAARFGSELVVSNPTEGLRRAMGICGIPEEPSRPGRSAILYA